MRSSSRVNLPLDCFSDPITKIVFPISPTCPFRYQRCLNPEISPTPPTQFWFQKGDDELLKWRQGESSIVKTPFLPLLKVNLFFAVNFEFRGLCRTLGTRPPHHRVSMPHFRSRSSGLRAAPSGWMVQLGTVRKFDASANERGGQRVIRNISSRAKGNAGF